MAKKFLVAIDLAKNELQNGVIQNLAAAPSSPVKGQVYFNSGDNTLYYWNGSAWVSASGGGIDMATADARYVNISGDTMGGDLGVVGRVSAFDPVFAGDLTTKSYVDNLVMGLAWKDNVRAATTANITLSGPLTVDGVAVVAGDRVLVKNQTTASANGIYIVQAGAWIRPFDADESGDLVNAAVFVSEGTTLADTSWVCTADAPITVGTTNLPWAQTSGPGTIIGGAGLTATGNTVDVGAGTGITVNPNDVALNLTYTDARYAAVSAGAKRYAVDVGGATSQVITHSLGTLDVIVQVYRKASPFDQVECDVEHTSTTTCTLRFSAAPAAAEYRAVVLA